MKENRGFTLVEVLAVVIVLDLIMVFVVPVFLNTINKMDSMYNNVKNLSYLDIRNLNITSSTRANNAITNFKSGATIIVKNNEAFNK